jgi:hypothetical protein
MTPTELLSDYKTNKRYGSIEFVYKGGNIVFVKKVETLITAADGKNPIVAPRGENGTHNGNIPENYR